MKNISIKAKWRQILANHPAALRGEVYNAVIEYLACGQVVDMSEAASVAFDFIRYEIDVAAAARARRQAKKSALKPATEVSPDDAESSKSTESSDTSMSSKPSNLSGSINLPTHAYPPGAKTAALLNHIFTPLKDIDRRCMNVAEKRRRA